MSDAADGRLRNPPHPGAFVKAEVIEALNLSVTEAAEALGITRAAFSTFLHGRSNLSPEMALRIEKAFAISMAQLMHMQCDFDIAQAKAREDEITVARFLPVQKPANQPRLFEPSREGK